MLATTLSPSPFSASVPPIPADIPEDFLTTRSVGEFVVPSGANFLLVGTFDNFYSANLDSDNNFGERISAVPEPASPLLIATIIGSGLWWRRR